jgi:tripartite-type tricarboxylate transporter receptor subunit TctC
MIARIAAALLLAAASAVAPAQSYPNKPIKFVVAFPPGGGVDILARTIQPHLQEALGQPIVVENRAGANGNLATEMVAKAAPDGYTILMSGNGLATNPALLPGAGYDFFRDLAPVAFYGYAPLIMVVPAASGLKSAGDVLAQAKASPGKLTYASAGAGSAAHLSSELLKYMARVDIVHVPYKGGPPAILDLIGARVDLMLLDPGQALPHIKSGKLRAIAVSGAKRSPQLPDVAAVAEALPKYEANVWWGIVTSAKTPPEHIARLNAEINKALSRADVQARLADISVTTEPKSAAEFGAYLRAEVDKWTTVVKAGGLKAE